MEPWGTPHFSGALSELHKPRETQNNQTTNQVRPKPFKGRAPLPHTTFQLE